MVLGGDVGEDMGTGGGKMDKKIYTVRKYREGKWWMIEIPEIEGLTQTRDPSKIEAMARSYIAVDQGLEPSDIRLAWFTVDPLAKLIWETSRKDEGTISAMGADIIAAAIRDWLLSDERVEAGAMAFYEQFDSNPCHRRLWPAPEQHIPWWLKNARAVLESALGE